MERCYTLIEGRAAGTPLLNRELYRDERGWVVVQVVNTWQADRAFYGMCAKRISMLHPSKSCRATISPPSGQAVPATLNGRDRTTACRIASSHAQGVDVL